MKSSSRVHVGRLLAVSGMLLIPGAALAHTYMWPVETNAGAAWFAQVVLVSLASFVLWEMGNAIIVLWVGVALVLVGMTLFNATHYAKALMVIIAGSLFALTCSWSGPSTHWACVQLAAAQQAATPATKCP